MYQFKSDKYRKSRGGKSNILDVSCEHCGHHVAFYQKDGPGLLKRMYVDRFVDTHPKGKTLKCINCDTVLGHEMNYKKENRIAYRLFVGSVHKKIVSKKVLD